MFNPMQIGNFIYTFCISKICQKIVLSHEFFNCKHNSDCRWKKLLRIFRILVYLRKNFVMFVLNSSVICCSWLLFAFVSCYSYKLVLQWDFHVFAYKSYHFYKQESFLFNFYYQNEGDLVIEFESHCLSMDTKWFCPNKKTLFQTSDCHCSFIYFILCQIIWKLLCS